jgi:hypothetical protein
MYLFLLFCKVNSLIFYYDTNTSVLNTIEYKYKNYENHDIFVFLPGTSAFCKDYSQLFYTINKDINVLCINYKNDINSSIEYYEKYSFQDKSKLLEKPLYQALKKIKTISGMNYLSNFNKFNNGPRWDRIIASGHSQGGVIVTGWGKIHNLTRLVLFSGPGCQFGKRLHDWIKLPFATDKSKIYGIESLQDKILPFYKGNKHFGCKKIDGVFTYIRSMGLNVDKIQVISPLVNTFINETSQIIVLNITFLDGIKSHLFTSLNMRSLFQNFRKKMWLYIILQKS